MGKNWQKHWQNQLGGHSQIFILPSSLFQVTSRLCYEYEFSQNRINSILYTDPVPRVALELKSKRLCARPLRVALHPRLSPHAVALLVQHYLPYDTNTIEHKYCIESERALHLCYATLRNSQ